MQISRRDFLKGVLALPIAYHPLLNLAFAEEQQEDSLDYFHMVEKIPRQEATGLEQVITKSNPIMKGQKYPSFPVESFPEIAYRIKHIDQHEVDFDLGNAVILNKDGFFITPAHVISDKPRPKRNELKNLEISGFNDFVYYDTANGFVKNGNILAYNLYDDIAIGKMDVLLPRHPTFHISRKDIKIGDYLYVLTYDDFDGVQNCIDYAIDFIRTDKIFAPEMVDKLGPDIYRTRSIITDNPSRFKKKFGYDFAIPLDTIRGESGDPIYWKNGDLAGLLSAAMDGGLVVDGETVPIAFAVSGNTIAKNIQKYLDSI